MAHPHPAPRDYGPIAETREDRLIQQRATDHAQIRIRRAITLLAEAREELTTVIESGAVQDVRDAAEAARDELDNADQMAAAALRIAVDACGLVEIHEQPVTAQAAE